MRRIARPTGGFTRAATSAVGLLLSGALLLACSTQGQPSVAPAVGTTTSAPPASTIPTVTVSSAVAVSSPPSGSGSGSGSGLTGFGAVGVAGVNDPTCTSEHRPVVLLHGTFSTVRSNYAAMIPRLQATGRCVYGINYGLGGLQSVRSSAQAVATFIDQVLAVTGAEQVDVVAFSQGGLVLRAALRLYGAAPDIATAVLIAPTFHGTTSPLIASLPTGACAACADQAAGSSLLADLDAGSTTADGDLDGDVSYAVVGSRDDTVVTPLAAQVPQGPAERIRSVVVQDNCPDEYVDHIALPANSGVISWAIDALETDGQPDPTALTCS